MPSTESANRGQSAASRDPFAKLAKWYDILHSSKNYNADSLLYAKHLGAKPGDTVIEWGCGTGEFTRRFAWFGWKMIGVDASKEMLAVAAKKEVPEWAHKPTLINCSLRAHCFGMVPHAFSCAPFAVLSYAGIRNEYLIAALQNIRSHLGVGGRFVFDVVHAAAAATCLRENEVKGGRLETEQDVWIVDDTRRKTFRAESCIVEIQSTVAVSSRASRIKGCDFDRFESTHLMRAFSPPELHLALNQCGFRVLDIFAPWRDTPADEGTAIQVGDYYLMVVAEAV